MIHPTAIIDEGAQIGKGVKIGAYAVIGNGVILGDACEVGHHAVIEGPTQIGPNNRIFPFAAVGLEPQDMKFHGEASRLEIGQGNLIREYVTINRGSEAGGWVTKIGDQNWIMAYCHIAHDCIIGNHIIMANGTTLGGHVVVKNHATLGGMTGVHQFCRIGEYAMTGGQSMITQDITPYVTAVGNRAKVQGLNYVGLERKGFNPGQIEEINKIYRIFFLSGKTVDKAIQQLRGELAPSDHLQRFIDFVESSQRGVCRPTG